MDPIQPNQPQQPNQAVPTPSVPGGSQIPVAKPVVPTAQPSVQPQQIVQPQPSVQPQQRVQPQPSVQPQQSVQSQPSVQPQQRVQPQPSVQQNPTPIPQPKPVAPRPTVPTPAPSASLEDFIRQSAQAPQPTPPQPQPQPVPTVFPPIPPQASVSTTQVIEKIVYQKQKVHGFFRTLTIIALLVIGFLMLMEALNIFSLNLNGFNLSIIYPIFIILSSIVIWSYKGIFGKLFGLLLFLVVVGGFFTIGVYTSLNPSTKTQFGSYLSYPSATDAKYSKLYVTTLVSDLTLMGKQTTNFIEGNYGSDRNLNVFSGSKANYQYYSLQEETNLNLLQNYYSVLSLGVNSTQPLYLYVKNLLALQKIDLSATLAKVVQLHAGAMISDVVVSPSMSSLDIQASLADITLHLPKDVGVKLYYKHFVGKLELADLEQKGPGYYESLNLASAQKVITITMKFGAARTKITWDK